MSTKWWWSKKSKKAPKEKSIASSINGADEGASMFSLYSNDQSLYCPSTYQVSSSIRGHHTKSEYSGNYSDVESNASILSKPWISRNMIENRSIRDSLQNMEVEIVDGSDKNNNDDDGSSVLSTDDKYAYSIPMRSSSTDNLDNSIPPSMRPKRRASLVDYIVNKPLHGKLRVRVLGYMTPNV